MSVNVSPRRILLPPKKKKKSKPLFRLFFFFFFLTPMDFTMNRHSPVQGWLLVTDDALASPASPLVLFIWVSNGVGH